MKRLFPLMLKAILFSFQVLFVGICSLLFVIKFNKNQKKIDHLAVRAINKPTVQQFRICFFFFLNRKTYSNDENLCTKFLRFLLSMHQAFSIYDSVNVCVCVLTSMVLFLFYFFIFRCLKYRVSCMNQYKWLNSNQK